MTMKAKQWDFYNSKTILAIPDHYACIGRKQEQASAASGIVTQENGRYVVKAGTPYPANDATAIGLVFNDYDVTDGDVNMAILIHGFVLTEKLPVTIQATAKTALKQITFIDKIGESEEDEGES